MTGSLSEDLAGLTGEEVYNLVCELNRCETSALEVMLSERMAGRVQGNLTEMWADFQELKLLALSQVARITVPISEAAKIIYRARYARNHPVRVPGT